MPWRRAQSHRAPGSKVSSTTQNLFGRRPTPAALNRRDDPNAIRKIGHKHDRMPITLTKLGVFYLRERPTAVLVRLQKLTGVS